MSFIKVTQTRSCTGQPKSQRLVVKSLGLKGINHVRVHKDNNCIRGMLNKVQHLVSYELNAQAPVEKKVEKKAVKKTAEKAAPKKAATGSAKK